MFLQLEKTHSELIVTVDAVMRNHTRYTASELRMEYYRKRQHYTWRRCDLTNYVVCDFYSIQIPSKMYRDIVYPS